MLAVHPHMIFCTEYPPPQLKTLIYLFQFSLLSPDVKVTSLVHWHSSIAVIPPPTWKYSATLLSTRSSYNKQYKNITQHGDYLDNNNCAPSFLRSLCEIGGDCFGPRYFSGGAQLPKKNTEVQNNHRRIHTMTETKMVQSYYCH